MQYLYINICVCVCLCNYLHHPFMGIQWRSPGTAGPHRSNLYLRTARRTRLSGWKHRCHGQHASKYVYNYIYIYTSVYMYVYIYIYTCVYIYMYESCRAWYLMYWDVLGNHLC